MIDFVALLYLSMLVIASANSVLPPILILLVRLIPSAVKLNNDKSLVILTFPDGFKSRSTTLSSLTMFRVYTIGA